MIISPGEVFLLDLTELLSAPDSAAAQDLAPFYQENEVTISDNSVDNLLGNTDELLIQTAAVSNGILVNDLPAFRDAGFPADVWLDYRKYISPGHGPAVPAVPSGGSFGFRNE